MKHLHNLVYLSKHKFYVFIAGRKVKAPVLALIVHDWSKLLPSEWFPYANYFFTNKQKGAYFHQPGNDDIFDRAWLLHIHRNPHHWQFWVLREDEGATKILDMPERYIREMIADWMGAGRVQTGTWGVAEWYAKNKNNIRVSDKTRARVEELLAQGQTTN